ncbi:MAG TPA: alpha/beta hydrolase family protein [Planctomycetaceae bacterium]|nr:alpha/beta hydrolase family protein [Planctomycetaceae bacterium]
MANSHSVYYRLVSLVCLLASASNAAQLGAEELKLNFASLPETGRAEFVPGMGERKTPQPFRLKQHEFEYQAKEYIVQDSVKVFKVTFPSPVRTDIEVNNTVHGEYFLPAGEGPFPGVIVLHILGGEFPLSELVANSLAQKGVAALFLKMPYYGERRDKNSRRRMISQDPDEIISGMTQGVLDIRRGAAWLRSRPEIDPDRLGVTGISLGGIMSALSAPAEPSFKKVAIYLGGGNLPELLWERDDPKVDQFRRDWIMRGGSKQSFLNKMGVIDPARYGKLLSDRDVLMVAAKHDEIIPPAATNALWNSIGTKPELIWLDSGHITAARYIFGELVRLQMFFNDWQPDEK